LKKKWSLPLLLDGLHQGVEQRLVMARTLFQHPVMKGDASEAVWIEFLRQYLPKRYEVSRAVVVDSKGEFSDSIDIVIHDRHFTPFILQHEGQTVLPAESVYAVFEAKQVMTGRELTYAGNKAASVRKLFRTSQPVTHVGGRTEAQPLKPIIAGILALEVKGRDPFGSKFLTKLEKLDVDHRLDIGCAAATGMFMTPGEAGETYTVVTGATPTTAFLFELTSRLQEMASVPVIDLRAYAAWLK
jgi:hypothetical protein